MQQSVSTFEQLRALLATDEDQIEKELLRQPDVMQKVSDECCRLGKELDKLKIDEKAAEATVYLFYKREEQVGDADGKKAKSATVKDLEAEVNSNKDILRLRYERARLESEYDRWLSLFHNHKDKLKTLIAIKDLIVSGYTAYKRVSKFGEGD
jgi:hypothetical protein